MSADFENDPGDQGDEEKLSTRSRLNSENSKLAFVGVMTLLGGQFNMIPEIKELAEPILYIHGFSMLTNAVGAINLLRTPAEYVIAEKGRLSERLHRATSHFILEGVGCLTAGMSSAAAVAGYSLTGNPAWGAAAGLGIFAYATQRLFVDPYLRRNGSA